MEITQIVAIVRTHVLEDVEARLRQLSVPGVTIARVKGFGEYANYLKPDWMSAYARIEIFADVDEAPRIIEAIMQVAHTGTAGDGIVAVLPVDRIFRIRDHRELHTLHWSGEQDKM